MPDEREKADLAAGPVELSGEPAPPRAAVVERLGEIDDGDVSCLTRVDAALSVVVGAAVDDQRLAGDEAGVGAGEECNGADQIGRRHVAAERAAPQRALLDARYQLRIGGTPSLSVKPGATLLTSILCGPSSVASARVSETTAPLLAT